VATQALIAAAPSELSARSIVETVSVDIGDERRLFKRRSSIMAHLFLDGVLGISQKKHHVANRPSQ